MLSAIIEGMHAVTTIEETGKRTNSCENGDGPPSHREDVAGSKQSPEQAAGSAPRSLRWQIERLQQLRREAPDCSD
jgi:hypothetical protein